MLYCVDSWVWIEYFAPKTAGKEVKEIIEGENELITPTSVIAETYFKILTDINEEAAEKTLNFIKKKSVIIPIDEEIAKLAAKIKKLEKLALADAFVLATAKKFNAILLTGDSDFKNIQKVHYLGK